MKRIAKLTLFLLLLAACNTTSNEQQAENIEQKADFGKLDIHADFQSKHFHNRDITVWMPEDYSPAKKYGLSSYLVWVSVKPGNAKEEKPLVNDSPKIGSEKFDFSIE